MNYSVINIREIDDGRIATLLSINLSDTGVTKKTKEFWRWKHKDSYFGQTLGYGAFDGDELVSLRPFMQWQLRAGKSEVLKTLRPVDTVTAVSARRKGLFTKLTNKVLNEEIYNFDLLFNTPNANSLPGNLKLGWNIYQQLALKLKITKPFLFVKFSLKNCRENSLSQVLCSVDCIYSVKELNSSELSGFLEAAEFFEANRPFQGLRTPRTAQYLKWRYQEHPNAEYYVYKHFVNGIAVGFVIFRQENRKGIPGYVVCDVFVQEYTERALKATFDGMHKNIPLAFSIAHFMDGSLEAKVMRKCLYFPVKKINLAVNFLRDDEESLKLKKMPWDLTFSELEVF